MTQGKTGSRGREERPEGQIYRMDRSQLLEIGKVTWLWQRCFPKKKLSACAKKTQVPWDSWTMAVKDQIPSKESTMEKGAFFPLSVG